MGDELRGENLVHLNVRFSTETELKKIQDFLYEKSGQGVSFTGLVEAMVNEVTIVTAVHNIKSNKGSKTAGVDKIKMDKYLQMPKDELILLIQSCFRNYRPKPARREYIEKSNGKKRPLGIPTVLDRIIQECVRIIIEPICEARFYPQSYGFRPYRAQKHAIRGIINVINAGCKSPDQPVWAIEGDIKGCFDNINHRLLLQKLWRIGIHDKRVLKIISQMLKAGYMENDLFHATELGTPQGGILSPLLSNVYLNDFDWYVGRMYMEPHRQCKHKGNDTRRLKWAGVTPKYNYRYADDWVILTSTEKEALRLKWVEGKWFGITYAFITHSHYEPKPFDQKMTPYTVEGRRRYVNYRAKHKSLPCDRPSVNSPNDIAMSAYAKGRMNFEYYMNREYAYSRDKGKCKCCGNAFSPMLQKNCHHVKNKLPLDRINKVPNLVWLCEPCHRMVHNSPIPPELNAKTVGKIMKYREKLKM